MKENNNLLPTLSNFVPRVVKNIKYSRKVKVADIKQYLVDEYKLTKELDNENKKLIKELKQAKVTEEKYDLALITLSEYKERLKTKDEDIKGKREEIKKLEDELKLKKDENNTLIIEKKDLQKTNEKLIKELEGKNNKIIEDFRKQYKTQIIDEIRKATGTLSKTRVFEIIEDIK